MISNHVAKVTLTVELANGDLHSVVTRNPSPSGGNPRFLIQQVSTALDELSRRVDDTLSTYGEQITL